MKFKIAAILLCFMLTFTSNAYALEKESNKNEKPKLNCHSAVVIDQNSGRVLYGKNHNKILPMASTTKIITAIVAIENGNLKEKVKISKKAASINGSSAKLKEGEEVSLEELIYGLMLKSGNDAAVAIAEHIGKGKVENFISLMNKKVVEIGLYNTHFVTPHGLDADGHETTAEDLAKATAYAFKNDTFEKISKCREIVSGESGTFNKPYNNINKFLFKVPNADGVKTGYTGKAGKCLVASVFHNNGRYIAVTLNSGDRWKDCENLTNYAKDNFTYKEISNKDIKINPTKVLEGKEKKITGIIEENIFIPVLKDSNEKIDIIAQPLSVIPAPIKKGEQIGNLVIKVDGKIVSTYPLKSDKDIDKK